MRLSFEGEIEKLTADLRKIKESAIPKATTQALNRTATGVRTDMSKHLNQTTGEKVGVVRRAISVNKATRSRQVAELNASRGYAANLIEYVQKSKRVPNYWNQSRVLKRSGKRKYKFKGVRAKAWGESKIYEHTFIGNGSRGPTVYARIGKERDKLKRPYGPSIRQQFKSKANIAKMKAFAKPRFEKEMAAAVKNQIRIALK